MNKIIKLTVAIALLSGFYSCFAGKIDIARLKYGGGGDWYNDPEEETNLLKEFSARTGQEINTEKFNTNP